MCIQIMAFPLHLHSGFPAERVEQYPDPLWGTFSWYDFSCLAVSWVGHYLHSLEPSIKQGIDHNLLQQIVRVG